MRYGEPSIASRLQALTTFGCDRILIMPLYPQYAAATTATVCDEAFRFLMAQRRQPAVRILPAYYDDPYYIEVLASSLQAEIKSLPFVPDVILASYHGMPKAYVDKGDPYYGGQCVRDYAAHARARLVRRQQAAPDLPVALRPRRMAQALHDATVKTLAKKGIKIFVVITPGFRPTAWRRWKRSRSRTPTSSRGTAGRTSCASPA